MKKFKVDPIYIVNSDDLGFLEVSNPCGTCKHVREVINSGWYRSGDTSPNAFCALLRLPVSSHVGTCIAQRTALRVHLRRLWGRFKRVPGDILWWFKHRLVPKHRYHVINTGRKPGYYDPHDKIVNAVLNETHTFVVFEEKQQLVDWEHEEGHKTAWAIFKEASDFWVGYRSKCESYDNEDKDDQKAVEMCKKVLDHIMYMWHA